MLRISDQDRVARAQLFAVDPNGGLDFAAWSFLESDGPLAQLQTLTLESASPETVLIKVSEQEILQFGGKSGFEMLGRHYCKYFFRTTSHGQTPLFCDTELLVLSGKVQSSTRARINFVEYGELEQFGLGALREL